jgi:hypothetical protein
LKVNSVFGRGREPDLDLFEPAGHQRLEQFEFLADVHRHRQRLVSVPKIHTAPDRRPRQRPFRPTPVGQPDRWKRWILGGTVREHVRLVFEVQAHQQPGQNKTPLPRRQWGVEIVLFVPLQHATAGLPSGSPPRASSMLSRFHIAL